MFLFSKKMLATLILTGMGVIAAPLYAEEIAVPTNSKIFKLKLGATRVIYNPDASGAALSVSNQQDYPILIQSKVYMEDKKSLAPFIVTPPLFRLEAGQQTRLRIVRTGGAVVPDRESLKWLCVGGIPPKDTDVWADNEAGKSSKPVILNLEVRAHNCIKLLVRPSGVKGTPMNAAADLTWRRQENNISVHNASPFYMNLSSVTVGGKTVKDLDYVAPFAERSFTLPEGASGKVEWKIITDVGGESRVFLSPASV